MELPRIALESNAIDVGFPILSTMTTLSESVQFDTSMNDGEGVTCALMGTFSLSYEKFRDTKEKFSTFHGLRAFRDM